MARLSMSDARSKPSIRADVNLALGAIYRIRIGTSHDRWTDAQRELILRIERDLVALREELK